MQEFEYIFYLTNETNDRLRVNVHKEKGNILEFVVQYEAIISGKWQPVVRYDTAHGFAHKDVMTKAGKTIKQPLFFENYNLALTYATIDLKTNWKRYRKNFEGDKND